MRTILLNVLILSLVHITYGQNIPFEKYDFNNGGYYILGTFSESDKNTLVDSLGEFYTNDINVLNQFKREWVFNKIGKRYSCGYHYNIYLCRQGEIIERFAVNLNCNEIVSDNGYFYFDPNKLRIFYGKFKKPVGKLNSFKNIEDARNYRRAILKDSNLIMVNNPKWINFEGSFRFTYHCKAGTKDCLDEDKKIFNSLKAQIKNKYPKEKFEMSETGGSWTTIEVLITCNKSLSYNFNLPSCIRNEYFGMWEPFDFSLKSYWTLNQK